MSTMHAIRFYPPGGPQKFQQEGVPIPSDLASGEMLIKVHAASVIWTELTWPIYQTQDGSYHPTIPCHDYAGTVERTGPGFEDSEIKPGSEVCVFTTEFKAQGIRKYEGALAEYAVADIKDAVLKPKNMSLLEAASIPLSALTAWQAIHDQAELQKGQRFLITGAAGATGIWAVQFAKLIGAYVIGTASSQWSFRTLKTLGCDEIIDYKTQDLAERVSGIDLVLDTVGDEKTVEQISRVVKKTGRIVSICSFDIAQQLPDLNAKFFIVSMNHDELRKITELIEREILRTFVDSVYPLEKAAEAFRKGEKGHLQGKVMVQLDS